MTVHLLTKNNIRLLMYKRQNVLRQRTVKTLGNERGNKNTVKNNNNIG